MPDNFAKIMPMKAKASDLDFLKEVSNNEKWAAGEKHDGYREILYLGSERNEMLSSLGTSHIDKVPQFKVIVPNLAGTVLDCEGMSPTKRLEDNASCFKAYPYNAISWQKTYGPAFLVVFDILIYKGGSMTSFPLKERRLILESVYKELSKEAFFSSNIRLEKLVTSNKLEYWESIIKRPQTEGHEGIILKDLDANYQPGKRGNAWLKVKRLEKLSYTIMGFTQANLGKFGGLIGAVIYGKDSRELGTASGMSDEVRLDMTDRPNWYIGKTAWFNTQEITDNGVMRHPRYLGLVEEDND